MLVPPKKGQLPVIAVSGQLFDIVSNPADLTPFRIALRSWFTSYLTQVDEHVNHSTLAENIYFYEVLQEWLETPVQVNIETVVTP